MTSMIFSRIGWIDICRGIGIILVLYGHALLSDTQRFLIYAFHMPLFFFLSGLVSRQSNKDFLSIVKKNIKQILIPYFLFALATLIVGMLIQSNSYSLQEFFRQLYGILYGNGNEGYLAFNVALWFLPCLFITKIAFAFLTRFWKSKKTIIQILFLASLLGYFIALFLPFLKLPFGIETSLTASVFFGAGYVWNNTSSLKNFMKQYKFILFWLTVGLTILFATLNFQIYGNQIDMRLNRLNDYLLFYLGAFSGIFSCVLLSMIISKNMLLEYIGKHSLVLFSWHTVLYTYLFHISFRPIDIAFISAFLYLIFATTIILLGKVLMEKIKFAYLFRKWSVRA